MNIEDQLSIWRSEHDKLQSGIPSDSICIRDGIVLNAIADRSRFGFEFFCWRSPEARKEMTRFIELTKGRKSFFDIGSADGIFSCVFQSMNNGECHSFEPNPTVRDALTQNLRSLNAIIHEEAISDSNDAISGHFEDDLFVAGNDELLSAQHINRGDPVRFSTITIDDFCAGGKIKPDTIKIDVEGHEGAVLMGAKNTIQSLRPLIFLEVHLWFLRRHNKTESLSRAIHVLNGYTIEDSMSGRVMTPDEICSFEDGNPHLICYP